MTQQQVAICLGVAVGTVNRWEAGALIRVDMIPPLAELLGLDVAELVHATVAGRRQRESADD